MPAAAARKVPLMRGTFSVRPIQGHEGLGMYVLGRSRYEPVCPAGGARAAEIAGPFDEIWVSFSSRYEKYGMGWLGGRACTYL
jgi:hypothetical protein